jgi:ribose transport system permease protein
VILALVVLVAAIGLRDPRFLQPDALLDLLRQASFVAIIAMGLVFLLAMREIDLSVGSSYALAILAAASLMVAGVPPWVAAGAGVLVGAGLGAVNGVLTNLLAVPTIVVTLGTLSMFRGLVLVTSDASAVVGLPADSSFFALAGGDAFGVPVAFVVAVLLCVVLTVVFRRTRFGLMVRAIGSNDRAAAFSGIPARRIRFAALVLVGAMAGTAGMLTLAYFQSADPTLGSGLELLVIAAAIIGGTSLAGGRGTVVGALLGALIIAVINSGLVRFEVPANWTAFATGAVIVLAVALDGLVRRRRAASAARRPV